MHMRHLLDNGVFLPVEDLLVVGEQDGVVGLGRAARGEDSPGPARHRRQHPVIHQQVIHQQLVTYRTRLQIQSII